MVGTSSEAKSQTTIRERLVFLSYSRKDVAIIRQVADLIKGSGGEVFRDEESIGPGEIWKESITLNIESCERMLVFWCRHSKESPHVASEVADGIRLSKKLVPVRFDQTPLNDSLKPFQAIDVRPLVHAAHEIERWERLPLILGFVLMSLGALWIGVQLSNR
jgi:hypothetical protein